MFRVLLLITVMLFPSACGFIVFEPEKAAPEPAVSESAKPSEEDSDDDAEEESEPEDAELFPEPEAEPRKQIILW